MEICIIISHKSNRKDTFAMAAYGLSELRREHIKNKKTPKKGNLASLMPIKKGIVRKTIG